MFGDAAVTTPLWALLLGLIFLTMALVSGVLAKWPITGAIVYLLIGVALSPFGVDVLHIDPLRMTHSLELTAEAGLLVSLFSVGLQIGVPMHDGKWRLPVKLAFLSLGATVLAITVIGTLLLNLSLGASVLLGAILAPTDPVLAAGIPSEHGTNPDRIGFSLAAEGGLNDGAAYPFVLLGLGLMGVGDANFGIVRWLALDLLWATAGGLFIGGLFGMGLGRLVVYLRSRHGQALGLDMFLGLGLIGASYGAAQLCHASGFLSVFAAGLALHRVSEKPISGVQPLGRALNASGHAYRTLATHSQHASAMMTASVEAYNGQIEKITEMALVLLVGAMLPYVSFEMAALWFVPLLLFVLRPASVLLSTAGEPLGRMQRALIAWFGIRGIGSVFYVLFALRHGLPAGEAQTLLSLTIFTVIASIGLHGVSAQPLMHRYFRRRMK